MNTVRFIAVAALLMRLAVAIPAQSPADTLLLKDYKPRSIYHIPQTRVEKARYPVIDMHAHAYAVDEASLDRWVKTMDDVGVEKITVMINRSGKVFDDAAALYRKYPARFDLWCGIDYTGYQEKGWSGRVIAELERCRKAGAVGVGELSDKGRGMLGMKAPVDGWGMHFDDPRMDPILEKCADLGMPVNIHVGEDMWMYEPLDEHNDGLINAATWHIPDTPDVLRHDAVVETLARAAAKHPRTIFIACHYANCCTDLGRLGAMLDTYPNLYADIGARYHETAAIPRTTARFIARYQDRIVYGTDMLFDAGIYRMTFRILESEDEHFYIENKQFYHWPLGGFGLSDAVLKKVYRDNALAVLEAARKNARGTE